LNLKPDEIQKKWILIDAEDLVVGRLASIIAMRLRGKHLPTYTPHMDCGDNVVVINADKVKLTGKQARPEDLLLAHRSPGRHQGSHRRAQLLNGRFPERVLENAVRAHDAQGPACPQAAGNLRVYAGESTSA
jgi:large subunit ribosomal protein L13